MADKTGVARLRPAIENQRAAREACFSLPIGETTAICDECEDELAAQSWAKGVPVPVDRDGNAVPLTTRKLYDGTGREVEVRGIALVDSKLGGGLVWRVRTHGGLILILDLLHLERPDSWERLEEDIREVEPGGACGYFGTEVCTESCPAHAAPDGCIAAALKDVMRRTKALAERDAKEVVND